MYTLSGSGKSSTDSHVHTISVVVVSFNRPKQVNETVASLLNQSIKPLEIVVIDDASTPPLKLRFNEQNLKLIRFDKEQGLSNSRNYGVNIAKGDYVAFIDDDAVATVEWLEEIQKGIKAGADILGGPLKPLFKAKPPLWWNVKDFGVVAGVGNTEPQIWGANMIIKKEVFEKIGFFNPKIGRTNGKLLSCEDSELIKTARPYFNVVFVPKAVVLHFVHFERMTLSYVLRWRYFTGKTIKCLSKHKTQKTVKTGGRLLILMMKMAVPFTMFKHSSRIEKIAELSELLGILF